MEPVYMQHSLAFYLNSLHLFHCYHFKAWCKWTETRFNKIFVSLKNRELWPETQYETVT